MTDMPKDLYLSEKRTELEEKIADVLTTYMKNRKQSPDPLYYKALRGAVERMFVQLTETAVAESFEEEDSYGDFREVIFEIREIDQLANASYIESKMLRPLMAEALIAAEPCWGEKIAIKYGYFEEEPNELQAVAELLKMTAEACGEEDNVDTEQFANILIGILDAKIKAITAWTEADAERFFAELKNLRPAWAETYEWHIVSLDLYEWFCLKNNLTFHQFPTLYGNADFYIRKLGYRVAAYALRYPSGENPFVMLLENLHEYAKENPGSYVLKNLADIEAVFTHITRLEPVENLALNLFRTKYKTTLDHESLLETLKEFVEDKATERFTCEPDENQLHKLYTAACRWLHQAPELDFAGENGRPPHFFEDGDDTPAESETADTKRYRKNEVSWIIRTTLEPFADCMHPDTVFTDLCNTLSVYAEESVDSDDRRRELFDHLRIGLAEACEKKLAQNLAYAVLVRLTDSRHQRDYRGAFALRLAVARHNLTDCTELPELNGWPGETLGKLGDRLREEFTGHPLIANQLLARIYELTFAVYQVSALNPISHHYYLASAIKDLLDDARASVWIPRPGRRTVRYSGDQLEVYADDTGIVDRIYRDMCELVYVQPCADVRRVM